MREDGFSSYTIGKAESLATPSRKCSTAEPKQKKKTEMFGKLLMIKLCINGCVLIKQEDFNLIMVLVNEKCVVFICTADLTSSVKQSQQM